MTWTLNSSHPVFDKFVYIQALKPRNRKGDEIKKDELNRHRVLETSLGVVFAI